MNKSVNKAHVPKAVPRTQQKSNYHVANSPAVSPAYAYNQAQADKAIRAAMNVRARKK